MKPRPLPIVYSPLARQSLLDIATRLEFEREGTGLSFLDAATAAVAQLATFPELGRKIEDAADHRRLTLSRFRNYIVIYRVSRGHLRVTRIIHAAQNYERFQ